MARGGGPGKAHPKPSSHRLNNYLSVHTELPTNKATSRPHLCLWTLSVGRWTLDVLCLLLLTLTAHAAPLSGTKSVGPTGDYASLTAAIADVNAVGNGLGGTLVLELQPTYVSTVETFPLTIPALTGSSAVNTLTIRPASGATGLSISSADTTAATVDLNGAQFITIDGRPGGVGSNAGSGVGAALSPSVLTIANTSTTGVALRFINEASTNTVRYTTLRGVNTSATSGTVVFSTTTGANGNDNNTIDHCDIRDGATTPTNGIYSSGTSAPADNSGNTASNCNIFNFYAATAIDTAGVRLDGGNTDWIITGNSFYQTVSRIPVSANVRTIYVNNTSGNNFTVAGNFVGGRAPNAGGTAWTTSGTSAAYLFQGIHLNVGTSIPSSVQGNTIANFFWRSNSANSTLPGVWSGIYLVAGLVNIGTVTGNTFGSGTGVGSITVITSGDGGTSFGIGSASSGTVAIANNTIGSITVNGSTTSVSASLTGISVSAGTNTISNNILGSIGTPSPLTSNLNSLNAATSSVSPAFGQQVTGILSSSTTSASITGNTVANLNNNFVGDGFSFFGQVRGIVTTAGVNATTGNTVRNLSTTSGNRSTDSAASVLGISQSSTAAGQTVAQNTVHSLANTAVSVSVTVTGIYYSGSPNGTNVITRNLVHSLGVSFSNAPAELNGMQFDAGAFTAQNNMVRMGFDASGASAASAFAIYGIVDNGANPRRNFYHNSVYLGGTQTSGSTQTFAFGSAGTANDRIFQNNIFVNARSSSGGTGKHYAVNYNNGGTGGLTASGNLFLASGTRGVLGLYKNTDVTTLAAWQATTGQDATSTVADPTFVNPTGDASAVDLHVASTSPAVIAGLPLGSVTDDFDGQARSSVAPTVGADEVAAPNIAVTQSAALTDGAGGVDFGTVTLGGSRAVKTFTITNPGAADLTGLAFATQDGANPGDFMVSTLSGTIIPAAGGSVTFTVTFTPSGSGLRSAAIHLTSNVTGTKNPFDIALTGTGQTFFQAWAATNGVASDPNAVCANGQKAVVNFAFGLSPTTGGGGLLAFNGTLAGGGTVGAIGLPLVWVEATGNGTGFSALFIQRKDAALAGLTYTVEFSADVTTWSASITAPTVLADDGTYQIMAVPYPPLVNGAQARFSRVRVTLAP